MSGRMSFRRKWVLRVYQPEESVRYFSTYEKALAAMDELYEATPVGTLRCAVNKVVAGHEFNEASVHPGGTSLASMAGMGIPIHDDLLRKEAEDGFWGSG